MSSTTVIDLIDDIGASDSSAPNDPKKVVAMPGVTSAADPASIQAALERAVMGSPITPAEFRAALDDEDLAWIASGRIPLRTARQFAALFAETLTTEPGHPVNTGAVTCWACRRFQFRRCTRGETVTLDGWHHCESFQPDNRT